MKIVRLFTGFILGMGAIFLFVLASSSLAIEEALLNRETYTQTFSNPDIFNDLLPALLPAMIEITNEVSEDEIDGEPFPIDFRDASQILNAEDWRYITSELVPPEWLQSRFSDGIDVVLGIINADTTVLDMPFDFSIVAENLQSETAAEVSAYIVERAPDCGRTQLDEIRSILAGSEGMLPICNPGDDYYDASVALIYETFAIIGASMPTTDNNTVREVFNVDENVIYNIELVRTIDTQVLLLVFMCPMALFSLIVFFSVRSLRGLSSWTAFVGILTGILILGLIVVLQLGALSSIREINTAQNDIERLLAIILANFFSSAIGQATGTLIIHTAIFFAIGFVAVALLLLLPSRDDGGEDIIVTEDGQIISTAALRSSS